MIAAALLMLAAPAFIRPLSACACSCQWRGAFLKAAEDAPLVVVGKILRHHPGKSPAMDVLVLETLKGGLLGSGIAIQMGDGMHCRPTLDVFPVGTAWVLAINGKGAKPGSGWAISHCGEYWLKVEADAVVGSIDGEMGQVKSMPLREFKNKFLYPKFRDEFTGRVEAGEPFRRAFGSRFEFLLDPMPEGWQVVVREFGRDENLARLTPPFHFMPNPRDIEGWHFLENPSACVHRPHNADAGPGNPRGHKVRQGDGRTPEGRYAIVERKADSAYHSALRLSYPNAADKARARALWAPPGGDIMIRGGRKSSGEHGAAGRQPDWTDGCIAVTNREIEEIWAMTPIGTAVEIVP